MVRVITDPQEFETIFPIGSVFWTLEWHGKTGPIGVLGPFEVLSLLKDGGPNGTKVFVRSPSGDRQTVYANVLTSSHLGVCSTKEDAQVHLTEQKRLWRNPSMQQPDNDDQDRPSQG